MPELAGTHPVIGVQPQIVNVELAGLIHLDHGKPSVPLIYDGVVGVEVAKASSRPADNLFVPPVRFGVAAGAVMMSDQCRRDHTHEHASSRIDWAADALA